MASQEHEARAATSETEPHSDTQMSAQAASEAVAIANQQEWSEKSIEDIDDLLDDIGTYLENETTVTNFKQKGGQ